MSIKSFLSGLTSKAGKVGLAQSPDMNVNFGIFNGETYNQQLDSRFLVGLNKGWVAICSGRNASTCASVPMKLFYHNKTGRNIEVTPTRSLSNMHTKNICKSLNITLKKQEMIQEIIQHPILDLFKNVNPTMNYYDFAELNFAYLGIIGNSYTEIIFDENGMPAELNPLLAEYVTPIATGKKEGKILYYLYEPEDIKQKARTIKPENMLHFAQFAPGNTLIGRGDLENCISAQERYCYYDAFEKYLGLNNSRPDFIAAYKGNLNEKDLREAYKQWNKMFKGVNNSGKVAVTGGDLDIKTLSMSPKDLQYQIGRQWALKEIAGAFGIPEALVTVTDVNRANAVESINNYLRNTIYPKMVKYCSKLNEQLVPKYDQDLFVWFEEQYLENPVEKTSQSIQAYQAGIIDKNEARSALGYEAIEETEETEDPDNEEVAE